MIVQILRTDHNTGVREGQLYNAKTYAYDPSKVTLLNRVTKAGKNMKTQKRCNEYCSNVKLISK